MFVNKHLPVGPEVQIHGVNWESGTGTEFLRPHEFSFWTYRAVFFCSYDSHLTLFKLCFGILFLIMSTTESGNSIFIQ